MNDYSGLDRYALQAFKGCHNRVRDGKVDAIHWPRSRDGYIAFCAEIGPKPASMEKASVGRIDHDLGYHPGNVRWEEHRHNSVKRKGTKWENYPNPEVTLHQVKFKKGTPEHTQHQRDAAAKRWSDPQQHIAMSKRLLGNDHARRAS